jgi:flagellar hook protein FlgE
MMRSMYSGVSGMRNFQTAMDTIGNNIANVNTVGFKASTVKFEDILNQTIQGASAPNNNRGGTNPKQVGLGVSVASISVKQSQGNLQNTGKTTDMAIQGNGFFVVAQGSNQYFTRAGNFDVDANGNLVNGANGLKVQGWTADIKGNVDANTTASAIQLPMGKTIAPIATSKITYQDNLNAYTNGKLNYGTSISLTDVNGKPITLSVELTPVKDAFNTYNYSILPANGMGDITSGDATGTITLDQYGVVKSISPGGRLVVTPTGGSPIVVQLPQANQNNGGFFNINPVGEEQTLPLTGFKGAGTYGPMNILDQDGNNVTVKYTVSSTGGNSYKWAVTVEGGEVTSGAIGTFDWTAGTGVTNVSEGTTNIQSNAGNTIHIQPPIHGGAPAFSVVENAPAVADWGSIGAGTKTLTFTDASIPPITMSVPIEITGPDGASGTTYTYTVKGPIENGKLISGASGQFDWDGTKVTNSLGKKIVIQSTNGLEIDITPPLNGDSNGNAIFRQVPAKAVMATFMTPPEVVTSTKVYDSLGVPHTLTTKVHRTGTNQWGWTTTEDSGLPITNGRGTLAFDTKTGYVTNSPGGPMVFTPVGADPVNITPDFSKVTQGFTSDVTNDAYGWPLSTFEGPLQDGYPLGILTGYNIDTTGKVVGIFSNGMNQDLAQVAIATFTNPGGLMRSGDTMFQESSNSGAPQVGQAGVGGRGTIAAGSQEMSNVDLAQEFTEMIVTERGFQANSKIITSSDEMLQTLVELKR